MTPSPCPGTTQSHPAAEDHPKKYTIPSCYHGNPEILKTMADTARGHFSLSPGSAGAGAPPAPNTPPCAAKHERASPAGHPRNTWGFMKLEQRWIWRGLHQGRDVLAAPRDSHLATET